MMRWLSALLISGAVACGDGATEQALDAGAQDARRCTCCGDWTIDFEWPGGQCGLAPPPPNIDPFTETFTVSAAGVTGTHAGDVVSGKVSVVANTCKLTLTVDNPNVGNGAAEHMTVTATARRGTITGSGLVSFTAIDCYFPFNVSGLKN